MGGRGVPSPAEARTCALRPPGRRAADGRAMPSPATAGRIWRILPGRGPSSAARPCGTVTDAGQLTEAVIPAAVLRVIGGWRVVTYRPVWVCTRCPVP